MKQGVDAIKGRRPAFVAGQVKFDETQGMDCLRIFQPRCNRVPHFVGPLEGPKRASDVVPGVQEIESNALGDETGDAGQ